MMDHFPCQWLLVLVWLKPLFPSVFLVREASWAQISPHLTVHGENALVILLHWTLSSNLHIANNKIIDRIVDHKHFTSFQIGFYSLFTTIRYLKCKVLFLLSVIVLYRRDFFYLVWYWKMIFKIKSGLFYWRFFQ